MADELLSPSAIETLAIEAFARRREVAPKRPDGMDAWLDVVPGGAAAHERGTRLTVRLFVADATGIRDIKEQEVVAVPATAKDALLPAWFEGVALSLEQRTIDEIETLMPHDFFPWKAFSDPGRTTAEAFAATITNASTAPEKVDIGDTSGTAPIAENAELERAIADDPRLETILVYADWLSERGDPRGELIACSAPTANESAKRRAAQILSENERYFVGNLFAEKYEENVRIDFALGWIKSAWIGATYDLTQEEEDFVARALRALLTIPSSKLIESLTLGCFDFEGDNDYGMLLPILVEGGPRKTMRSLFLGDMTSEDQEISWTAAGDLAVIDGLYPNLRSLKVHTGSMNLAGGLAYPKLESLTIESGGLARENVAAIAAATLPELGALSIWFGSPSYGGNASLADLGAILAGSVHPKLVSLGVMNAVWTDDACAEIGSSAIAGRLERLDLSMGTMTDAGAEALLARRGRFERLRELDVSRGYLGEAAIAALEKGFEGVKVESGRQKTPYGEDRYVSVSE